VLGEPSWACALGGGRGGLPSPYLEQRRVAVHRRGFYGFPARRAAHIAVETVTADLRRENECDSRLPIASRPLHRAPMFPLTVAEVGFEGLSRAMPPALPIVLRTANRKMLQIR